MIGPLMQWFLLILILWGGLIAIPPLASMADYGASHNAGHAGALQNHHPRNDSACRSDAEYSAAR